MLKPAVWLRVALASLLVLMAVSLAFVVVVSPAPAAQLVPPGLMLAVVKVLALVFVSKRIWNANVYALQWSSMLILLFIAEGTVRAASDPQPSAALGFAEAIAAAVFFVAVLAILRPIKQASRARSIER